MCLPDLIIYYTGWMEINTDKAIDTTCSTELLPRLHINHFINSIAVRVQHVDFKWSLFLLEITEFVLFEF